MSTLTDRIEATVKDALDGYRNEPAMNNKALAVLISYRVAAVYQVDTMLQRYKGASSNVPETTLKIPMPAGAKPPLPPTMQTHQQRVVDEKRELDDKLTRLVQFIGASPIFSSMAVVDRDLMCEQRDVMMIYSRILRDRIARFGMNVAQSMLPARSVQPPQPPSAAPDVQKQIVALGIAVQDIARELTWHSGIDRNVMQKISHDLYLAIQSV